MTDWQTPPELFNELSKAVGGFAVDAAASGNNHLCPDWYGPDSPVATDALAVVEWASPAFCNPPYGRGIERWLEKFHEQQLEGVTTVAILPARVETRWWYEGVVPRASIVFLVGRIPFVDPSRGKLSQPDHASAVCLYEPDVSGGAVAWLDWKERIKNGNNQESGGAVQAEGFELLV